MKRTARVGQTILVSLLALIGNLAFAAGTINGDGLMYWALTRSTDWRGKFLPGHLLYCPVETVLGQAVGAVLPTVPLARVMLFVNQLAGAAAVGLVFATAGRFGWKPLARWLAALGMMVSFGVWVQTTDVEVYALALLFVTASLYVMACYRLRPTPQLAAVLGVVNSLGALVHLATLTLGFASVLLLTVVHWPSFRRGARALATYLGVSLLFFGGVVCAIGFGVMHLPSLSALLVWLKSSEHDYAVVFDGLSILRAGYGLVRTFLFLEFFWTASKAMLAAKALAVLLLSGAFLGQWARSTARLTGPARTVLACSLGFVVPQVVLGVYFFGSDTERWVFLTPLVWLVVAGYVVQWSVRSRALAGVAVAALAAVNLAQGIGPLAADHSAEEQVRALDQFLHDDALVIAPGHDWMSWYYFYPPASKKPKRVTLIELAVRHKAGRQALFEELGRRIKDARLAGRQVLMIRILDPRENDKETPWQELAGLGYTSGELRAWFGQYPWEEVQLNDANRTRVYCLRAGESIASVDN